MFENPNKNWRGSLNKSPITPTEPAKFDDFSDQNLRGDNSDNLSIERRESLKFKIKSFA